MANPEKRLMGHLFTLWFATREHTYTQSIFCASPSDTRAANEVQFGSTFAGHTRGSSYICSDDKLDMEPENDPAYPLSGKVSLPRMILAQFDSITYTRLLAVHGKHVLRELEALITQNKRRLWFTIYLSLFILLSEASWISRDLYGPSVRIGGRRMVYAFC
jgi:hypothetical protein